MCIRDSGVDVHYTSEVQNNAEVSGCPELSIQRDSYGTFCNPRFWKLSLIHTLDKEIKERRNEIQRNERRVEQKESNLDKKLEAIEKREAGFAAKEEELNKQKAEITKLHEELSLIHI